MNKLIFTIPLLLSISSCSVSLTKDAQMTREIQKDWANQCKFLGTGEQSNGTGWTVAGDARNTKNAVRNDVATRGGNSYVINDRYSSGFSTSVSYEIYNCPDVIK